jgi:hypothetical protein
MDKVALVTVFIFQSNVNDSLHCSCIQTACTNELSGVGCCPYCVRTVQEGLESPTYFAKAASSKNGLSDLSFPYIWYRPSGTCFQLNLDNLLQFPSTVPSSTIARQMKLNPMYSQHPLTLSFQLLSTAIPRFVNLHLLIFPLILSTLWEYSYLSNAVHRGSSVSAVSKMPGQRSEYQVLLFGKTLIFSRLRNAQTGHESQSRSCSVGTAVENDHSHLVPRFGTRGVVLQCPYTSLHSVR